MGICEALHGRYQELYVTFRPQVFQNHVIDYPTACEEINLLVQHRWAQFQVAHLAASSNVVDLFSVLMIKIVVVDQGFVESAIENEFLQELDQVLGLGHNLITWFRALGVSKEGRTNMFS